MIRAMLCTVISIFIGACGGGNSRSQAPSLKAGGSQHRFTQANLPSRNYLLYIPESTQPQAPLLIYLHGCAQNAEDAMMGTRWNELAMKLGIVVAYPEQKNPNDLPLGEEWLNAHLNDGNGLGCWGTSRTDSIVRDSGEAGTIAGITQEIMARPDIQIDPQRVYAMGISSGGFMASVMAATYPDLYAAIGIVAGCGYLNCADPRGLAAYKTMTTYARRMPVIQFHGTADEVIAYPLGLDTLQQWLGTNDWIDNGQADLSISHMPYETEHIGLNGQIIKQLGSDGDPCLNYPNSPCLGGAVGLTDSYPHTIDRYRDSEQCLLIEFWTIHGLMHNYPNGNTEGSFTDPLGPDINQAAMRFFMANPKNGPLNCIGKR